MKGVHPVDQLGVVRMDHSTDGSSSTHVPLKEIDGNFQSEAGDWRHVDPFGEGVHADEKKLKSSRSSFEGAKGVEPPSGESPHNWNSLERVGALMLLSSMKLVSLAFCD